jgi:hypothetical protein
MLSYTSIVTPNPGRAKNRGKTEAQNRPTHARRSRDSPDFVAPLLAALAESLDVPDIFARISAAARRTVPHDLLMLGLLREDPQGLRRRSGPAAWKEQIDTADRAELASLPWLTPSASSAHAAMLAQLFGDKGLELNSVVRFDNSAVGRAALQAGTGMMLLREEHAVDGEQEGRLAMSPIARAEIALLMAHQSGRKDGSDRKRC